MSDVPQLEYVAMIMEASVSRLKDSKVCTYERYHCMHKNTEQSTRTSTVNTRLLQSQQYYRYCAVLHKTPRSRL